MHIKDKRTSFSHTKEQAAQLKEAADEYGVTVSAYIGEAVTEKLQRDRRMAAWRQLVGHDLDDSPGDVLARVRAMFDRIEESHRP
ncbi:hypothetical protein ACFQVD_08185 [Streptosporangium amethystogenes subsp. fukuiense]|uniref:Antitoxin n=1 Tax=Streptosporangium amethystogenes subsp. fukuiense TaxID=698418 RepID=A0ABW2SUV9_9ACTN